MHMKDTASPQTHTSFPVTCSTKLQELALFPRLSPPPVFDHLQFSVFTYCMQVIKTEGRGGGGLGTRPAAMCYYCGEVISFPGSLHLLYGERTGNKTLPCYILAGWMQITSVQMVASRLLECQIE